VVSTIARISNGSPRKTRSGACGFRIRENSRGVGSPTSANTVRPTCRFSSSAATSAASGPALFRPSPTTTTPAIDPSMRPIPARSAWPRSVREPAGARSRANVPSRPRVQVASGRSSSANPTTWTSCSTTRSAIAPDSTASRSISARRSTAVGSSTPSSCHGPATSGSSHGSRCAIDCETSSSTSTWPACSSSDVRTIRGSNSRSTASPTATSRAETSSIRRPAPRCSASRR
jgi:hypothetical protein